MDRIGFSVNTIRKQLNDATAQAYSSVPMLVYPRLSPHVQEI